MNPLWLLLICPACGAAGFIAHALCAMAAQDPDDMAQERTTTPEDVKR